MCLEQQYGMHTNENSDILNLFGRDHRFESRQYNLIRKHISWQNQFTYQYHSNREITNHKILHRRFSIESIIIFLWKALTVSVHTRLIDFYTTKKKKLWTNSSDARFAANEEREINVHSLRSAVCQMYGIEFLSAKAMA